MLRLIRFNNNLLAVHKVRFSCLQISWNFYFRVPFQEKVIMVVVAQLVRAPDCGSGGRGFETHLPPKLKSPRYLGLFFWQKIWESYILF